MRAAWGHWVVELVDMLDGLGCIRHLPEGGGYREQPARDMDIYRIIRERWVKRTSAKNGR